MTIYILPTKARLALLRARKPTKMAGVPQTKPGFAKNRVFATLKFENCRHVRSHGMVCKEDSKLLQ